MGTAQNGTGNGAQWRWSGTTSRPLTVSPASPSKHIKLCYISLLSTSFIAHASSTPIHLVSRQDEMLFLYIFIELAMVFSHLAAFGSALAPSRSPVPWDMVPQSCLTPQKLFKPMLLSLALHCPPLRLLVTFNRTPTCSLRTTRHHSSFITYRWTSTTSNSVSSTLGRSSSYRQAVSPLNGLTNCL